jgi:hypothetical protein
MAELERIRAERAAEVCAARKGRAQTAASSEPLHLPTARSAETL